MKLQRQRGTERVWNKETQRLGDRKGTERWIAVTRNVSLPFASSSPDLVRASYQIQTSFTLQRRPIEQSSLVLNRNLFVGPPVGWGGHYLHLRSRFWTQTCLYTCKPVSGSGKSPRSPRTDKGLNATNILMGTPSRLLQRDFILMAAIIHKSLHSRSRSSASSNGFQEHLPIWWRIWCHQSTSQWWLTANCCCCWVFAECSSPFWQSCSQPGTRSQAVPGETQQEEGLVLGISLGSTFCPWLPALLLVPKTFTRTCFEKQLSQKHIPPRYLRVFPGKIRTMKVMKDGACSFLFQVFPTFWDLNTQASHPSWHKRETKILQKNHFFPSYFQLHPSSS